MLRDTESVPLEVLITLNETCDNLGQAPERLEMSLYGLK